VELRLRVAEGRIRMPRLRVRFCGGHGRAIAVRLRHSRGAKPLKEIFERMNIDAAARRAWPVLEWTGGLCG